MPRCAAALCAVIIAVNVLSCGPGEPRAGTVQDEAMRAGVKPEELVLQTPDYFHDMDDNVPRPTLSQREIEGRNMWMVWTGGDDRLWDRLTIDSLGTFDLLKTISSHPPTDAYKTAYGRHNRWRYLGLVNEPCFKEATGPDPNRFGLWLDVRDAACPPDPFADASRYPGVKVGARGTTVPVGSYYGEPTGIVGLRLFPNPDFDEKARARWNSERFYNDPTYYFDRTLVRPYRVGMSCGFCHVGPNPIRPPANPEEPKWENLSANVGAQYFWWDRVFNWRGDGNEASFFYQALHVSRPGTLDTSLVSTDSINNPRSMNAVYYLLIWPGTVWTPRVLKDGSDSVGGLGALNRVYLNIGLFSEEWLLHFRAVIGGKAISPIPIETAEKNSVYWRATELRTADMARFFLASTDPHHLRDAPDGGQYLTESQPAILRGKEVFADRCARCHSSKVPDLPAGLDLENANGPDYLTKWNQYWNWTKTDAFKAEMRKTIMRDDFLEGNFLSSELRVPVTLLGINACSPLATNAIRGNIWDNFSSQSYKQLPSAGSIKVRHPVTGAEYDYPLAAGGRGYIRPASLVSLWSTAPFLQNNTVGHFEWSPAVDARMRSFQDSIEQMLWPEKRDKDALFANENGPGVGVIDRITVDSYLDVSEGYIPDYLRPFVNVGRRLFPFITGNGYSVKVGPFPKGMPVGLITNMDLLGSELSATEREEHKKQILSLLNRTKAELRSHKDLPTILGDLVDDMLAVSKCKDFVVNKGHYFGTSYFAEEPGLSDDDKRALIAYLKTF